MKKIAILIPLLLFMIATALSQRPFFFHAMNRKGAILKYGNRAFIGDRAQLLAEYKTTYIIEPRDSNMVQIVGLYYFQRKPPFANEELATLFKRERNGKWIALSKTLEPIPKTPNTNTVTVATLATQ